MVNISHSKAPVSEVIFGTTYNTRILNDSNTFKILSELVDGYPNVQYLSPLSNQKLIDNSKLLFESNTFESGQFLYRLRNSDGTRLVQIQGNKIYFNWIRLDDQSPNGFYPGFDSIFHEFKIIVEKINVICGGELNNNILYHELTYHDRIFYEEYIDNLSKIDQLLNVNPPLSISTSNIFGFSFGSTEVLNEEKDYASLNINNGYSESMSKDILSIEYSIRGFSPDKDGWFNRSREQQNILFRKLINKQILQSWV
ncbi:MAG: TIGR04255 family protein [Bacteroidia bacterium]|nr:TIGR04255 family protein [Bacteroidia bacterium]